MPEVRVSHLLVVVILVAIVVVPILIFAGVIGGFWFLTKENMEKGIAGVQGYSTAKTPGDAMDRFRDAIHKRDYKNAAYYCTKDYGELLKKAHANAAEYGGNIDKIREWGKNNGLLTDKLKIALLLADPFPINFKAGPAPKEEADKKTYGNYVWETPHTLDNPATNFIEDLKQMDPKMFQQILYFRMFDGKIELVREAEEWKLSVPVSPAWQTLVSHFNDRCKTYNTGLQGFWKDVNNQRYSKKSEYEGDVLAVFRNAK